jgi:HSP20 family protein
MVTRWDPFGEALSLRDAMNRLFEQAVLQPSAETSAQREAGFVPPLDVQESQDAYTIKVSLPGVKPDDVNIQYQQGMLTISGEAREEQEREQGSYHIRERRSGRFSRTLRLPDMVNADKAEASFEHGVLTLRLPKAEETKPRRIAIQSSGGAQQAQVGTAGNGQHTGAGTSA